MHRRLYHLLIVEDNPADVGLFKQACRESTALCRIHVAPDGMAAMRFLEKKDEFASAPTPDLVVLDLNLPKVGGHEVLQMIKADPELRSIPVIVLTTSDCRREVRQAYEEGACCFITKPADLEQYFAAVKASEMFWLTTAVLPERRKKSLSASASHNS